MTTTPGSLESGIQTFMPDGSRAKTELRPSEKREREKALQSRQTDLPNTHEREMKTPGADRESDTKNPQPLERESSREQPTALFVLSSHASEC